MSLAPALDRVLLSAADSLTERHQRRHGPTPGSELARVLALPEREWSRSEEDAIVRGLTEILRTSRGTQTLYPEQAIALLEIAHCGGLLGPIPVGGGKTLISLLAPRVLGAVRPMLALPAALGRKTLKEYADYALDWRVAKPTILSYERLARVSCAEYLAAVQPDLLICDEAHALASRKAAWQRIQRYLVAHPECRVIMLSGTMTRRSLRDYAHLARAALGPAAPVPTTHVVTQIWADVLDAESQKPIGALSVWGATRDAVRAGYSRRLIRTPGVVRGAPDRLGVGLRIEAWTPRPCEEIERAIRNLDSWELPDGQPISDPMEMVRHASTIGCGWWYRWETPPPRAWLEARRAWSAWVRDAIGRWGDTEAEVRLAVTSGRAPAGRKPYDAWREIAPTFVPVTVEEWITGTRVDELAERAQKDRLVIWYYHQALERALVARGLVVYGPQGRRVEYPRGVRTLRSSRIEDERGERSICASIESSKKGRNLQSWNRAIVAQVTSGQCDHWEQLLGRHHRNGQRADEVTFELHLPSPHARQMMDRARTRARYVEATTGAPQRLGYADWLTD